jgi:hypothetical protein
MRLVSLRLVSIFFLAELFSAYPTLAQIVLEPTTLGTSPSSQETAPQPATPRWSFSASTYVYFIPDSHEYIQPTVTADRDWLHLEARYNYEDMNTASAWVGYNLSGGDTLAWEFTPMLGGVFGDTSGAAIGYKGSLTWRKFELYSEGEYLFDANDLSDSYFYNWSELTYSPLEWFRFGIVAQHTRAYESDRDIQRGLLVGFTFDRVDFAAYLLNPDDDDPIVALALRFDF